MTEATSVFSLACSLLSLVLAGLGFATAIRRAKVNVWINEEDAARYAGSRVGDVEHRDVARLIRVHRNLLENFVPFVALGLLWLSAGIAPRVAPWLFGAFGVSRLVHVALFLTKQGISRRFAHVVGLMVLNVLAVGLVVHVVTSSGTR